jgi:hypothetical protein
LQPSRMPHETDGLRIWSRLIARPMARHEHKR